MKQRFFLSIFLSLLLVPGLLSQECVDYHKKTTPNIVSDWLESQHSKNDVKCSVCHGEDHKSANDYALWYGWSAMRQTLKEVETLAEDMRKSHK